MGSEMCIRDSAHSLLVTHPICIHFPAHIAIQEKGQQQILSYTESTMHPRHRPPRFPRIGKASFSESRAAAMARPLLTLEGALNCVKAAPSSSLPQCNQSPSLRHHGPRLTVACGVESRRRTSMIVAARPNAINPNTIVATSAFLAPMACAATVDPPPSGVG